MQAKNKPQKRRKYDQTFKDEVLKMIANGQSVPLESNHPVRLWLRVL